MRGLDIKKHRGPALLRQIMGGFAVQCVGGVLFRCIQAGGLRRQFERQIQRLACAQGDIMQHRVQRQGEGLSGILCHTGKQQLRSWKAAASSPHKKRILGV